jgi:long-chain acyl-CoA synthetase
MSLNLATLLTESVKRNPMHPAVIFDDFKMSYAELHGASNKFANILKDLGIQQGQKVAMMLPNIPQFMMVYYGILKAGAVVIPLNVLLRAPEITYHLDDGDAEALIVFEGFLPEALPGYQAAEGCKNLIVVNAPGSTNVPEGRNTKSFGQLMAGASPMFDMVATSPDDTAVILYTSGTTGKPKGAELSHFNMFFNALSANKFLGVDWRPDDIVLITLPMFHAFGQSAVMNVAIMAGATCTLMVRFDPVKAFEVMQRDKVTAFSGVPTMFFYLLNHPDRKKYDLSSLRICSSGGSAIPVEVLNAWERETGVKILEGYGLSETSPVASFNVMFKPTKAGSVGVPIWGCEMAIVDEQGNKLPAGEVGEIVIRGHNIMKGYYKRPEATAESIKNNGWFYSGDIGKMDEEGYFYIVDRVKDMIIRGGFNVYPREIEEVLYTHPAVAEAAVIGIPDPAMGEEVKAVVSLKPGQTATAEDIKQFCKERIAANKYPRIVEVSADPLPKNATGKILKRELKAAPVPAPAD